MANSIPRKGSHAVTTMKTDHQEESRGGMTSLKAAIAASHLLPLDASGGSPSLTPKSVVVSQSATPKRAAAINNPKVQQALLQHQN